MTEINSKLYFHKGIKSIDSINDIDLDVLDNGNAINGSYKFNDLSFTFLDITDDNKNYNIFANYLSLRFEIPKVKRQKNFKKEFTDFFKNEISSTAGIDATYEFEEDKVKINIYSSIPYKGEVDKTENIILPTIEIMYSLHLEIYLFFMKHEKEHD